MDLLDRDLPRNDTYLQIAADGVGPLNAETPANEAAIGKLMPGYTTGSVLTGLETETIYAIALFKPEGNGDNGAQVQVLHIVAGAGGKIREIHGVSRHVMGPGGEKPGMTLAQTKVDPAACRAGKGLWAGMAVCVSAAASNVQLLFSLPADGMAHDQLPPRPQLERGELQRILWRPRPIG